MYAERIILETDTLGDIKNLPKLPPNSQVEAIFLVLRESVPEGTSTPVRRPHPDIAGRVTILGDVMSSAPSSEWDLPT
jgi:hypothetical protein